MDQKGFTLLEVLIAIVISSILLGVVFIFFNKVITNWEKEDKNYIVEQQWGVFTTCLKEDLHNVFISLLSKKTNFTGNSINVEWTVLSKEGLKVINYSFVPYQSHLTRKVMNIGGEKLISERVLFSKSDLQSINFYYYDRENNYWRDSWSYQEEKSLPLSVKVEVIFVDVQVPPVIINLFINREY